MKSHTVLILVILFSLVSPDLFSQSGLKKENPYIPLLQRELKNSEKFIHQSIIKKPGHYTTKDWQEIIDEYWGEGLPTNEKLEIFDTAIDKIDRSYAAFQNLEINLDSLKNHYRSEIENGVSRGRFAAIMNHLSLALKEAHSIILDKPINLGTSLAPGVPLFVIGPWQNNSWFGAALTPLPDSSLLVYRALPSHKLGLTTGDIILGYDGIPWKTLYKELLKAELPILPMSILASTDKSITHCLLASAGLNWHLFETIDVVKHTTNDTLHLSTAPLVQQSGLIWGNEQLPVDGVPFPDFSTNDFVYWGIVNGTNIGYIYVTSWAPDEEYHISEQFYNAIDSLMNVYDTEGLILDFRNNNGGWMPVAHAGYSLLFNESIYSVAFDIRAGDTDHFTMIPHPSYTKERFKIPGNPSSFYDKPIAVLTGPGSVSNGDFESWRMKLHPMARLFGKSSCGAFATSIIPDLNNEDWFFYLTYGNSYPVNSPGQYLVHTDLPIDEEVWLTKEGVINGYDDVVNKAIDWIKAATFVENEGTLNNEFRLSQNYPNPFNPTTTIRYTIPTPPVSSPLAKGRMKEGFVTLKVYDVLGNEVASLINEEKQPGDYEVEFNASNLSSGVYFYRMNAGSFTSIKKFILMK